MYKMGQKKTCREKTHTEYVQYRMFVSHVTMCHTGLGCEREGRKEGRHLQITFQTWDVPSNVFQ